MLCYPAARSLATLCDQAAFGDGGEAAYLTTKFCFSVQYFRKDGKLLYLDP